jgi:hypothetical protein
MSAYTRSPKLIKGALIEFSERFLGPVPNVIVFQYNPESMTRTLEVWSPAGGANTSGNDVSGTYNASQTSQPHDPPETFSLVLELDAADELETPLQHPVAFVSGVADRIAAMELLLYPQDGSLVGNLLSSATTALSSATSGAPAVPQRGSVPVVLFVWGPGRIVPVRLTSFSVEEQAYSPQLYPIRAKVTLVLRILSPKDFTSCKLKPSEELAVTAYSYTRKQKEVLAASNVANSVESILSMLPF